MKKTIYGIFAAVMLCVVSALTGCKEKPKAPAATLYYSPSCPHCHKAMAFLDKVEASQAYTEIKITRINVMTREGSKEYYDTKNALKIPQDGVPLFVIGEKYYIGFDTEPTTGEVYRQMIVEAISASKADK